MKCARMFSFFVVWLLYVQLLREKDTGLCEPL